MNTIYAEYNMYHNSIDIYTIFIVSGTIVFSILGIGRTSAYLLVKEEHFSSIPLPAGSHEYCGV